MDNNIQNAEEQNLIRGVTYDTEPEKTYLILIAGEYIKDGEDEQELKDWAFVIGRQKAYDYIKELVTSEYLNIDIIESRIIVDSDQVKVTEGISLYEFMKVMKLEDKVVDWSSFDIEDFLGGDIEGAE